MASRSIAVPRFRASRPDVAGSRARSLAFGSQRLLRALARGSRRARPSRASSSRAAAVADARATLARVVFFAPVWRRAR